MYGKGISWTGDVLELGADKDIIQKRGSFYSYGETRLGQGRENAKQFLQENSAMTQEIEALIRGEKSVPEPDSEPEPAAAAAAD